VHGFEDLFKLQANYTMPDITFPKVEKKDLTDPRKLKEDTLARFSQYRNDDGVPMDYVLRTLLIPEQSPTFGAADTIYGSLDEELKLRYPMLEGADAFDHNKTPEQVKELEKNGPFTPIFRRNRSFVYYKAKYMFGGTDLWNHAAGYKAGEDGRGGLFAIFNFMFGHEYSKSLDRRNTHSSPRDAYSGICSGIWKGIHYGSVLVRYGEYGERRVIPSDTL
jgi:hypothetical protein